MSLSKLIKTTLIKEKAATILYFCTTFFILLFYYVLYDGDLMIYPVILLIFFLGIYLTYKFFTYKKLYECLENIKVSPSYQGTEDSSFEDIFSYIKDIHNEYISKIYALDSKNEEKDELLIEWIHNMKTSVSIISLAVEKLPSCETTEDIKRENRLLKENLEGVLNTFRLEDFSKDYVPEIITLESIVKEAINAQRSNFIYGNVIPKINISKEYKVLADRKWDKYLITQIISNAIKYSPINSKVYFDAEEMGERIILRIKDNGIGIKKEEINRIFEAFYTGSNGREEDKSSGMGLYMCKSICDNLSHEISIESTVSEGTLVNITYLKG